MKGSRGKRRDLLALTRAGRRVQTWNHVSSQQEELDQRPRPPRGAGYPIRCARPPHQKRSLCWKVSPPHVLRRNKDTPTPFRTPPLLHQKEVIFKMGKDVKRCRFLIVYLFILGLRPCTHEFVLTPPPHTA